MCRVIMLLFEDSDLSKSELTERLGQILFKDWKKKYNKLLDDISSRFETPRDELRKMDCLKELITKMIKSDRMLRPSADYSTEQLREHFYDFSDVWYETTKELLRLSKKSYHNQIEDLDRGQLRRQIRSKVRDVSTAVGVSVGLSPSQPVKKVKTKKSKKNTTKQGEGEKVEKTIKEGDEGVEGDENIE